MNSILYFTAAFVCRFSCTVHGLNVNYMNKTQPALGSAGPGRAGKGSHMAGMHGISDAQVARAIKDMKSFIASSDEDFATLLFIGDSTMSGLATGVLRVTDEVQRTKEMIYLSNDRDKKANGVPPGGEWRADDRINDAMTKKIAHRAAESTKALRKNGCNSGGGLETFVFRSGPYKHLAVHYWGFLPERSKYCWKPCMGEAINALRPNAVVWNIGFHLLNHDFTPSLCKTRHNPAHPGCGDYKEMVKMATRGMLQVGVPKVIWKHTNWVCEEIMVSGLSRNKEPLERWHDPSQQAHLEKQCQKDCPQYAGMSCYDWYYDAHASKRMYKRSTSALEELRKEWGDRVTSLDTFKLTRECCNKGCAEATKDGEHYSGLESLFASELISILAGS